MRRFQHCSERGFDFPTASSRLGSRPAASPLIESSSRCCLFGIGESSSSSSTTDSRSVADGGADLTNITGANRSNLATDGSVLLQNSSLQTGGTQTGNVAAGGRVGTTDITGSTIVGGDLLSTVLDFAGARIGDDNSSRLDFAGARIGDDIDNSSNLAGARLGSSEIGSITINDTGGDILTQALDSVTRFATLAESGRETSLAGILGLAQRSEQNRADADENTGDTLADLLDAVSESKTAADPDAQKNSTVLWIVLAVLAFLFFRRT